MARFDDARSPPAGESFSCFSMVTLTVQGARAAAGLPSTARTRRPQAWALPALPGPAWRFPPPAPEQGYCRVGPAGQPQTPCLHLIAPRYFHQQPPGLRAVRPPLTKAVYRPRHLRPVEVKVPYRLWSSTAPPLGPACVASIYAT
jgi:hypothetical protein